MKKEFAQKIVELLDLVNQSKEDKKNHELLEDFLHDDGNENGYALNNTLQVLEMIQKKEGVVSSAEFSRFKSKIIKFYNSAEKIKDRLNENKEFRENSGSYFSHFGTVNYDIKEKINELAATIKNEDCINCMVQVLDVAHTRTTKSVANFDSIVTKIAQESKNIIQVNSILYISNNSQDLLGFECRVGDALRQSFFEFSIEKLSNDSVVSELYHREKLGANVSNYKSFTYKNLEKILLDDNVKPSNKLKM